MRRDGSPAQSRDMANTHRNTLAVSSLLAGLCPLVGNSIYEGPTGTGDTLMKQLGDPLPGTAYAGMALELVGFASLVVLLGVLVSLAVRRGESSSQRPFLEKSESGLCCVFSPFRNFVRRHRRGRELAWRPDP